MAKFITLTHLIANKDPQTVYINEAYIIIFRKGEFQREQATEVRYQGSTNNTGIYVQETPEQILEQIHGPKKDKPKGGVRVVK